MDSGKLVKIIDEKNQRLEREALQEAADLIEQIANNQASIADAELRISKLREQLAALNVQQLDSKAILGE